MNYIFAVFVCMCFLSLGVLANNSLQLEVDSVLETIEMNYAPLQYKEKKFGFNWASLKQETRNKALQSKSQAEFFNLMANFFSIFKDAHVSVNLPSSLTKKLPLRFNYTLADGKTVVSYIDRKKLPKSSYPISLGDELVSFDGLTPDELRNQLSGLGSVGNQDTDRTYLSMLFTKRTEGRGMKVPAADKAELVIKTEKGTENYSIPWRKGGISYFRETEAQDNGGLADTWGDRALRSEIDAMVQSALSDPEFIRASEKARAVVEKLDRYFNLLYADSRSMDWGSEKFSGDDEGEPTAIGHRNTLLPLPSFKKVEFGLVLSMLGADLDNIEAGVFEYKGKKVGFLRLSSYSPELGRTIDLAAAPYILNLYIDALRKNSDVLLVDQMNNPGGYVFMADWIAAVLTRGDFSFKPVKFKVRPTLKWLREFAEMAADLESGDLGEMMREFVSEATIRRWVTSLKQDYARVEKGHRSHDFLSEPVSFVTMSEQLYEFLGLLFQEKLLKKLNANLPEEYRLPLLHGGHYPGSKYMVTNELCFSGGDYVPATLAQNGISLIGWNTAGAGGSVGSYENGIDRTFEYRLTQSLMVKADGSLVENNGQKPTHEVGLTSDDLRYGYSDFFSKVMGYVR